MKWVPTMCSCLWFLLKRSRQNGSYSQNSNLITQKMQSCPGRNPKPGQSPGVLWKEWCYSWNASTMATSCEELTHWKRLWCWERLKVGGEGDVRIWDGWMASPTQWTWVWVDSGSWWWTGRPGVLHFMGSVQRVGHDWATKLNFIGWDLCWFIFSPSYGQGWVGAGGVILSAHDWVYIYVLFVV